MKWVTFWIYVKNINQPSIIFWKMPQNGKILWRGLISSLKSHTHHLKIKKRLSLIYLEIFLPSSYVEKIPIWPTWKHLLFDTSFIFHWKPNSKMSLLCLKVSDTKVRRILSSIFCHMSSKWKLSQTGCNFILPLLFFIR